MSFFYSLQWRWIRRIVLILIALFVAYRTYGGPGPDHFPATDPPPGGVEILDGPRE